MLRPTAVDVPTLIALEETDPVSAFLYYALVTLLLAVLIGGMALGLALGGRLEELDD